MITRRGLLAGAAAAALAEPRAARAASGQFWGAIRWDAWWAPDPSAAKQAQGNLWINRWQFRAPSWALVTAPNQLTFTPGQAQMDLEIAAASIAGLKYWAYNYYPPSDNLAEFMNGLAFHRSSSIKTHMKYCLIVSLAHWGGTTGYSTINAGIASMMAADSTFIMSVSGAPVVYVLWDATAFSTTFGSSNATVKVNLDDLRAQLISAGLANPYVVLMDLFAASTMTAIGADCLGSYFHGPFPTSTFQSYTAYATQVQGQWVTEKSTGAPLAITAMTGWDTRPRIEQPVSFVAIKPWFAEDVHVVPGTNTQIAAHVQAGVDFINNFPSACQQKLGLIYSWDECDEGGSALVPTIGDPTGTLLTAVGAVVA